MIHAPADRKIRKKFGKFNAILDIPDLIDFHKKSYDEFLQKDIPPEQRIDSGLQKIFKKIFPVHSKNQKLSIEFRSYNLGPPRYDINESIQRGITYSAPLKICKTLKRLYKAMPKIVLLTNLSHPENNERFSLTGFSKTYSAHANSTSKATMMIKLKIPMRYRNSLPMILFAVAAASPGTVRLSRTKKLEKIPVINMIRYPNPATLASFLFESIFSPFLYLSITF